jgi:hypothetical protein
MVATIRISPYVSIQGVVTRRMADGAVAIRVCKQEYVGRPVDARVEAAKVPAPA